MKEKIKRIIEKIKDIFSLHCPECGGIMKSEYLDMEIDHIVYKCEKCGKLHRNKSASDDNFQTILKVMNKTYNKNSFKRKGK